VAKQAGRYNAARRIATGGTLLANRVIVEAQVEKFRQLQRNRSPCVLFIANDVSSLVAVVTDEMNRPCFVGTGENP
jgi:hypothetical protein